VSDASYSLVIRDHYLIFVIIEFFGSYYRLSMTSFMDEWTDDDPYAEGETDDIEPYEECDCNHIYVALNVYGKVTYSGSVQPDRDHFVIHWKFQDHYDIWIVYGKKQHQIIEENLDINQIVRVYLELIDDENPIQDIARLFDQ
jgi:hypothetical protein